MYKNPTYIISVSQRNELQYGSKTQLKMEMYIDCNA